MKGPQVNHLYFKDKVLKFLFFKFPYLETTHIWQKICFCTPQVFLSTRKKLKATFFFCTLKAHCLKNWNFSFLWASKVKKIFLVAYEFYKCFVHVHPKFESLITSSYFFTVWFPKIIWIFPISDWWSPSTWRAILIYFATGPTQTKHGFE